MTGPVKIARRPTSLDRLLARSVGIELDRAYDRVQVNAKLNDWLTDLSGRIASGETRSPTAISTATPAICSANSSSSSWPSHSIRSGGSAAMTRVSHDHGED